ncbi:MAG: ATP-binding protein [Lachnospiraceae bacterium]|nr:ATP-binding protein [Lachnospiraceae bacterium]
MNELKVDAKLEKLDDIMNFIWEELSKIEYPKKLRLKLQLAVEEIFVNIASYAYVDKTGYAIVKVNVQEEPKAAVITFIDGGIKYNPLEKEDPDLNMPLEERTEGGFGIYMVKNIMDDVEYDYVDSQNILTIKKYL